MEEEPVKVTPLLFVPELLPPVPVTVTAPLPPAVIWPLTFRPTPMPFGAVPDPPPWPITVTSPPLDVMVAFVLTKTPCCELPLPAPPVPVTLTGPIPPALI